jgi:hypothetical protein
MPESIHQTIQIIASIVAADNADQAQQLSAALSQQDRAFAEALRQVKQVRDFVGAPENILGNLRTKHGEIAEQVEVGVRNARDLLNQQTPRATFDNVGRTAPADYRIDDAEVQSKFVNGVNQNLDHVLKHMKQYAHFGRDGSYYHIPQDHYKVIQRLAQGESVEGFSQSSIDRIQANIQTIERLSGKPLSQVIKPGLSNYSEVQQGNIHNTLARHERDLESRQETLKQNICLEAQPNLGQMAQATAKGAAIGAGLRITSKLFEKYKQGKNPFQGDFTIADWQEVGLTAAQGGVLGGISGDAIYALTNFAELSAPFAGAVVSASWAIAALGNRYVTGELTANEFLQLGQLACAEAAIVGVSAAIGQTVIPIPILGATLGAIAGQMVLDFGKPYLGQAAKQLKHKLDADYNHSLAQIERDYQEAVAKIMTKYRQLGDLMEAAFDSGKNSTLRRQASITLARAHQVPEAKIIHTLDELDAFILG